MAEATQQIPTSINLEKEKHLEHFRDKMEDVWIEYQRTKLHATGEEVLAWMDSWLTKDEKLPPKCHR